MEHSHLKILDDLLKTAERDFDATVRNAAAVDDKSQKTSGLASIFLAAAFGFIKPESLTSLLRQYGNISLWLLYIALGLFVASLALCLRAMWLRKVPTVGVSLASLELSADFLLQLPEEDLDDEMMAAYRGNQIEIWRSAISETFAANRQKTRLVNYAQRVLLGGILVSALSLGLLGYAARNTLPSTQEKFMPEKKTGTDKAARPAGDTGPRSLEFGTGKMQISRQMVLDKLRSEKFIEQQVEHLPRA